MYRSICPHGCKTLKTKQPKSFVTQETYDKHMQQFHNLEEPIKEPIKDYEEELNIISNKMKALELDNEQLKQDNELLQSQLNNIQSMNPIDNFKKIKALNKKSVKKIKKNENNDKVEEEEPQKLT